MTDTQSIPPGFMRISAVYAMAGPESFDYTDIPAHWFPEIGTLLDTCGSVPVDSLIQARRLAVRTVAHVNHDHERFSSVLTLWFDGKPFAIIQSGGRSGRDRNHRLVTDEALLHAALSHVLEHIDISDRNNKVVSPDYIIPVEEIFDFYTSGVAQEVGLGVAQSRRDLFEYAGAGRDEHLEALLKKEEILIVALGVEPAPLLRSGDTYFSYVRALTPADDAAMAEQVDETGQSLEEFIFAIGFKALKQAKTPTGHVYLELPKRPDNFTEAVPL